MKNLLRKRRERRFNKAVKILKKTAERHRKADHMVEYENPDESLVIFRCSFCPNLHV